MTTTRTSHPVTVSDVPATAPQPRSGGPGRDRALVRAVLAVTGLSLVGSLVAVATGLSPTWWDAVGPTGRLSVPLPMNAALLVLGAVAAGSRRRLAVPAAALLALACTVAVVSGFFDGGYAAHLAPIERVCQVALVVGLGALAVLAARRAVHLLRG